MSIKKKFANFFFPVLSKGLRYFLPIKAQNAIFDIIKRDFFIYDYISMKTKYGLLHFYCPNQLLRWRAETLFTKEPETIEWIDNFQKESIFWDIGANMGCYTIYAGKKGVETYAFEPQCANYYILNKNIQINNLFLKIYSYCIAFSDKGFAGVLNTSSIDPGTSMSYFGESTKSFLANQKEISTNYQQGMIGFSIDEFIDRYGFQKPNYIKIDVDGIEKEIVTGAINTLKSPSVRSILVEIDDKDVVNSKIIIDLLELCGFRLKSKKHSEIVENSDFKYIYNYIFEK